MPWRSSSKLIPSSSALVEQERARFNARIAALEQERDRLRASHERLRQELELFKRRLFIAKAERIDTRQLELEYGQKLRELDHLAGTLGIAKDPPSKEDDSPASDGKPIGKRKGDRGTGRRDLRSLPLEEERIEIADPHLEAMVAEGKVTRPMQPVFAPSLHGGVKRIRILQRPFQLRDVGKRAKSRS